MAKHFLKTLIIFVAMIIIGLIGVYLISHYGNGGESANPSNNQTKVAK
jgi:hypothetical protein